METKIRLLNKGERLRKSELTRGELVSVSIPTKGPSGEDYMPLIKSMSYQEIAGIITSLLNEYADMGFECFKIRHKKFLKDPNTGALIVGVSRGADCKKSYRTSIYLDKKNTLTKEGRELAQSMRTISFVFYDYIKHLYEEQEAIKNQQAIERLVREQRKETA